MTDDRFLEQLLTLPTVVTAKLSPDGRWVAFVWANVHENLDVFVVPTDGSAGPIPLTRTPEATWLVNWLPDSSGVLVEEDRNRDERVTLYRVRLDAPGRMEPLTEVHPPYFLRGGALHPSRPWLFYGANYDVERGETIEATWIYRQDLETGERRVLARPARPAWTAPELNRPGTHLIYARKDRHPSGRQVWMVDVEGEEDREILNFGDEVKVSARWLLDGERVAFLTDSKGEGPQEHVSLGVWDRTSGRTEWWIDDPDRALEDLWVAPQGWLIVDEVRQARHRPVYLDPQTGAEGTFPALPGNLLPLGQGADGAWIGVYYAAHRPVDLVRFDLRVRSPEDLTSLTRFWERTELDLGRLVPAESVTWRSADGLEIQGWLYRARPNRRRAVIYVHGGPTSHSEERLNPQIQYLVARGFNVLDVNYRGSTGFGKAFREKIKEDGWGGREQEDIVAGARWLIEHGLAEPGWVGVTGTSYGGYSSWCQITRYSPDPIGAAAPICGMTDLVVDYETTRPDLRPYSEEMMGGSPQEVPEKYYERSPIHFVDRIRGKVLVVQGAQDPNVTPENMRAVVQALERHRIPYELLVFEDEGHGIVKRENRLRLYRRLADFFEKALG